MTGGSYTLGVGIRARGTLAVQGVAGSTSGPSGTGNASVRQTLGFGTGSGQFNLLVSQARTILAGASAVYDLYAGTDLKDIFGLTAAFRHVKSVAVWVDSGGDASGVRVGGGTQPVPLFADPTDMLVVFPSGPPFMAGSPAGIAVGATTNNLKLQNLGAADATVWVEIAGTDV